MASQSFPENIEPTRKSSAQAVSKEGDEENREVDLLGSVEQAATCGTKGRTPTTVSEEDRRLLRDKMREMFARIITDIDNQVLTVSESQSELDSQLDRLITTLDSIRIDEKLTDEMSANAKRISSLKTRLTLIHTILSNSSARCCRTLAACGAAVSSYNLPSSTIVGRASQTEVGGAGASSDSVGLEKQ